MSKANIHRLVSVEFELTYEIVLEFFHIKVVVANSMILYFLHWQITKSGSPLNV